MTQPIENSPKQAQPRPIFKTFVKMIIVLTLVFNVVSSHVEIVGSNTKSVCHHSFEADQFSGQDDWKHDVLYVLKCEQKWWERLIDRKCAHAKVIGVVFASESLTSIGHATDAFCSCQFEGATYTTCGNFRYKKIRETSYRRQKEGVHGIGDEIKLDSKTLSPPTFLDPTEPFGTGFRKYFVVAILNLRSG